MNRNSCFGFFQKLKQYWGENNLRTAEVVHFILVACCIGVLVTPTLGAEHNQVHASFDTKILDHTSLEYKPWEGVQRLQWNDHDHGLFSDYQQTIDKQPVNVLNWVDHQDTRDQPFLLIIVEDSLYPQINSEVAQYQSTLSSQGYGLALNSFAGSTPQALKNHIQQYYTPAYNLTGVVLIGNLPVAWYYHADDFDGPTEFPCDLYLMDLDGEWIDADGDGMYDEHHNGDGDTAPEIYLGRIDASNIPGDEVAITKAYFSKIQQYWNGELFHSGTGLTYTDRDWASGNDFRHDIQYAYDSHEAVWWPSINRNDYVLNRLPDITYEFIQIACHAGHSTMRHNFSIGGAAWSDDIRTAPPQALFYNIFTCGSFRFTDFNCLGNAYVLNTTSPSLTAVGSTKAGSMLDFHVFYEPIGQGASFGDAFQQWFEFEAPYNSGDISWFYGMTILGDPTLYPRTNRFQCKIMDTYHRLRFDPITFEALVVEGTPPYSYTWEFGDGNSSHDQTPIYVYTQPGTYHVNLSVTDSTGNTTSDQTQVVIDALWAEANGPYSDILVRPIAFTGSVSGGMYPLNWTWDFGDGNISHDQNPIHTYGQTGNYTVTLTVTDAQGYNDISETTATILAVPPIYNDRLDTYYHSIQQAQDEANHGDRLLVHPCTLKENAVITKQLSITGVDADECIIEPEDPDVSILNIDTSSVHVNNLTFQHGSTGIHLRSLYRKGNNEINDNTFVNLTVGVHAKSYLGLAEVNANQFNRNHFDQVIFGIILYRSSHNRINENQFINVRNSVSIQTFSTFNDVCFNKFLDGENGVYFSMHANNNTIAHNLFSEMTNGMQLWYDVDDNVFMENTVEHCIVGVNISSPLSQNNQWYHNIFVDNIVHATDHGGNTWHNGYPSAGNYWDTHQSIDDNHDGILDIEFIIPGGGESSDQYPLRFPFVRGDMNVDGFLTGGDIDGFVLALTQPQTYQNQYGLLASLHGDCNQDGAVNGFDIESFVHLLVQ